ncbi:MAG: hypothetical protein JSS81_07125 [Acidobacteria bacterium]|nr:hypothetical protein [Acidobacteriota bacterium]
MIAQTANAPKFFFAFVNFKREKEIKKVWLRTIVQIYQGTPGFEPGQRQWRREDEKWVAVSFLVHYIGPVVTPPSKGMYEFIGSTLPDNPVMGRYIIKGTDRDDPSSNQVNRQYVIGNNGAAENKVWLYNPGALTLSFMTLVTLTGTPASNNENTYEYESDLELYGVFLGANGFMVRKGGFGTGWANRMSANKVPFMPGRVYWTEI